MTDSKQSGNTQTDFETLKKELKIEIKETLIAGMERLEARIDKQLSSIKYWGIGGVTIFCIIFTAVFGFLFYYVNDHYQARFEKIESAVYTPASESILNEIREMKAQISEIKQAAFNNPINRAKKLKLNRRPDSLDKDITSISKQ